MKSHLSDSKRDQLLEDAARWVKALETGNVDTLEILLSEMFVLHHYRLYATQPDVFKLNKTGSLAVIECLIKHGAPLATFDPKNNIFYQALALDDIKKRNAILCWLLEKDRYLQLNCGLSREHIFAVLGEANLVGLIQTAERLDFFGLHPLHYLGLFHPELNLLTGTFEVNDQQFRIWPTAIQNKFSQHQKAQQKNSFSTSSKNNQQDVKSDENQLLLNTALQIKINETVQKEDIKTLELIYSDPQTRVIANNVFREKVFLKTTNLSLPVIKWLYDKQILFTVTNKLDNIFIIALESNHSEKRNAVVRWLLEDNKFEQLGLSLSQNHLRAILDEEIIQEENATPDAYGLTPADYQALLFPQKYGFDMKKIIPTGSFANLSLAMVALVINKLPEEYYPLLSEMEIETILINFPTERMLPKLEILRHHFPIYLGYSVNKKGEIDFYLAKKLLTSNELGIELFKQIWRSKEPKEFIPLGQPMYLLNDLLRLSLFDLAEEIYDSNQKKYADELALDDEAIIHLAKYKQYGFMQKLIQHNPKQFIKLDLPMHSDELIMTLIDDQQWDLLKLIINKNKAFPKQKFTDRALYALAARNKWDIGVLLLDIFEGEIPLPDYLTYLLTSTGQAQAQKSTPTAAKVKKEKVKKEIKKDKPVASTQPVSTPEPKKPIPLESLTQAISHCQIKQTVNYSEKFESALQNQVTRSCLTFFATNEEELKKLRKTLQHLIKTLKLENLSISGIEKTPAQGMSQFTFTGPNIDALVQFFKRSTVINTLQANTNDNYDLFDIKTLKPVKLTERKMWDENLRNIVRYLQPSKELEWRAEQAGEPNHYLIQLPNSWVFQEMQGTEKVKKIYQLSDHAIRHEVLSRLAHDFAKHGTAKLEVSVDKNVSPPAFLLKIIPCSTDAPLSNQFNNNNSEIIKKFATLEKVEKPKQPEDDKPPTPGKSHRSQGTAKTANKGEEIASLIKKITNNPSLEIIQPDAKRPKWILRYDLVSRIGHIEALAYFKALQETLHEALLQLFPKETEIKFMQIPADGNGNEIIFANYYLIDDHNNAWSIHQVLTEKCTIEKLQATFQTKLETLTAQALAEKTKQESSANYVVLSPQPKEEVSAEVVKKREEFLVVNINNTVNTNVTKHIKHVLVESKPDNADPEEIQRAKCYSYMLHAMRLLDMLSNKVILDPAQKNNPELNAFKAWRNVIRHAFDRLDWSEFHQVVTPIIMLLDQILKNEANKLQNQITISALDKENIAKCITQLDRELSDLKEDVAKHTLHVKPKQKKKELLAKYKQHLRELVANTSLPRELKNAAIVELKCLIGELDKSAALPYKTYIYLGHYAFNEPFDTVITRVLSPSFAQLELYSVTNTSTINNKNNNNNNNNIAPTKR